MGASFSNLDNYKRGASRMENLQGTEVGRSWAVQSSVMSINQKLPVVFVFTALAGFPLGTSPRNGGKNNVFL